MEPRANKTATGGDGRGPSRSAWRRSTHFLDNQSLTDKPRAAKIVSNKIECGLGALSGRSVQRPVGFPETVCKEPRGPRHKAIRAAPFLPPSEITSGAA